MSHLRKKNQKKWDKRDLRLKDFSGLKLLYGDTKKPTKIDDRDEISKDQPKGTGVCRK